MRVGGKSPCALTITSDISRRCCARGRASAADRQIFRGWSDRAPDSGRVPQPQPRPSTEMLPSGNRTQVISLLCGGSRGRDDFTRGFIQNRLALALRLSEIHHALDGASQGIKRTGADALSLQPLSSTKRRIEVWSVTVWSTKLLFWNRARSPSVAYEYRSRSVPARGPRR